MSGAVPAGHPDDQQAGAAMAGQAAGEHLPGRRRSLVAGLVMVVVVATGIVVAGVSGAFGRPSHQAAGNGDPTSTATITRRPLSSTTQVQATLGYAGFYTVVNQATGTITALPAVGQIVRQGRVLYRVNGSPVVLLYGKVPAYRALSLGMSGDDVAEVNTDLVKLGYATSARLGSDYFSWGTAYALEDLQAHLGVTPTGTLPLGQAVFLPTAIRITALGAPTVLGGPAQRGSALLTASSTSPVVTIDLDPAQQTEVKAGEQVTVTLPDGRTTPGVVSSVGAVATTRSSGTSGDSGGSGESGSPGGPGSSRGSGGTPTITVEVTLGDPEAAGHLDQAPVTVAITTGSVRDALVVPVTALLAQASGGYAVEVTGRGGHHLVAVSAGLFDDAAGLVQVSGPGLAAGQHVVVPAT